MEYKGKYPCRDFAEETDEEWRENHPTDGSRPKWQKMSAYGGYGMKK